MDRMTAMKAFVEAVRQRGLGAAAQALGISRSHVSRSIQSLEDDLGVRLMNRTTRTITLTEAGEQYFSFCDDVIASVEDMNAKIAASANEARGEISILAPKWMRSPTVRMLAAFTRAHPDIRPRLTLGGMAQTAYGFLEQGCEIALHTKPIPDSRIRARRLLDIPYALVAAPIYLDEAAQINEPADLGGHRCLVQYAYHTWQFSHGRRDERFQPVPQLSANTFSALRVAALDGLGIALLPRPIVEHDLAAGTLVEAMGEWQPHGQELYIAAAPGEQMPLKVRLLMDFARDWFLTNAIEC